MGGGRACLPEIKVQYEQSCQEKAENFGNKVFTFINFTKAKVFKAVLVWLMSQETSQNQFSEILSLYIKKI